MKPVRVVLLGIVAGSTSSFVSAQPVDAPPPAAQQIDTPPPAVPADDVDAGALPTTATAAPSEGGVDAGHGIEDIVVTATRREERLQRIPVTVTAITGQELTTRGIIDTRSLTQSFPALHFSRSGSGGQPVIRGVGSNGTSNGDESNVSTYIDGIYQPDSYSTLLELVEIQRVEVLRGPQGTVFGRNATGGLINVITPDPSFQVRGKVAATYGRLRNDADDVDVRGYITGPITSTIAGDFAMLYRKADGHVRNLGTGGTVGGKEVYDIRSKLMFQPTPGAKIILTGAFTDFDSEDNMTQPINGQTIGRNYPGVLLPAGPWETSFDAPFINDYKRRSLSLRTSFDVGSLNLETTGSYQYSKVRQFSDSDSTNIRLQASGPFPFITKSYSQEVRLLSAGGGPLNWLVGAYIFRLDSEGEAPVLRAIPPAPLTGPILGPDVGTRSYAAFAEGTYELSDRLFLTMGARFTHEKRRFEQKANGVVIIPESSFKTDKVTYRAALRYQLTDDTNIYASYGTGFKSGVFNALSTTLNRVRPETIKAAEAGIKADLARGLRTNLAVFYYDYSDLQVSSRAATGNTFLLQNAADAEVYGGELEVTALPFEGLSLSGSITYLHARYKKFLGAQTFSPAANGGNTAASMDVSGNNLIKSPEFTFNFSPRYEHELGAGTFDIGGNVFHSSRVYYDFANRYSQKPYTLVNAQVGYAVGNVRFSLSGTNLTNEVVYQQIRIGAEATVGNLERPRTIKVGAELRF